MMTRTLVAIAFFGLAGCQNPLLRSQSPDKEPAADADFGTRVETKMLGDYISVHGSSPIVLQGVGLVTGLAGTGGDPPPSVARTQLRDEMKRRGVKNPESILRDQSTALVVVRAYLPPLVRRGHPMDVEVRLPPNTTATSLQGGWLMETRLTEQQPMGNRVLEGRDYAIAEGPILISGLPDDAESRPALFHRGVILAGARSLTDRQLMVVLRNDFRSFRNSKRISQRIGQRFYHYGDYGNREPLAKALTDQQIELKLHPRYKDNDWRYRQVIRNIAFRESDVAARLRLQQLQRDIMIPEKAQRASLQFEAIGNDAIPFLKKALDGESLETRFHAAVALAYLGDESGVPALTEAARDEPAFRAYALAALAVTQDVDAQIALRELLHENSAETRYGAFRALTVLDETDPYLNRRQFAHGFNFHEIDSDADPMIHITHRRKPEVVLFGKGQKFVTPLALWAGQHIIIRAPEESDEIVISRYQVGKPEVREVLPNSITAVILKAVELGATYPDIAGMLMQAKRQHNLQARLEIDALPQAGRMLSRVGSPKRRIGNASQLPGMFDEVRRADEEQRLNSPVEVTMTAEEQQLADDAGRATAVDGRSEDEVVDEAAAQETQPASAPPARPTFRQRVAKLFERSR